jgi:hypothetical protein
VSIPRRFYGYDPGYVLPAISETTMYTGTISASTITDTPGFIDRITSDPWYAERHEWIMSAYKRIIGDTGSTIPEPNTLQQLRTETRNFIEYGLGGG